MKKKGSVVEHCAWIIFSNVILAAFLLQANSLDTFIFWAIVNAFSIFFWLGIGIDHFYRQTHKEALKRTPKPLRKLQEGEHEFYFMLLAYIPLINTISAISIFVISGWGKITGRS